MTVIENFAILSEQEQHEFAEALLKTINTEGTFTSDTDFVLRTVEASDLTGELIIEVDHTKPIEVPRKATWQCIDEEEAYSINSDPDEPEYENDGYTDIAKALRTTSATIDGYTVTVEVVDYNEIETVAVEVDEVSHEDAGIGHFEFWGHDEYDSRPYVEVTGNIVKTCDCAFAFTITPVDEAPAESEVEEEI